jgi:hypothetical protein
LPVPLNRKLHWQVTRLKTFVATIPVHILTLEVKVIFVSVFLALLPVAILNLQN